MEAGTSRALIAQDLGRDPAAFSELKGTVSNVDGTLRVRVDTIRSDAGNAFSSINSLIGVARASGATRLEVEGTIANPDLLRVLQRRYGATTNGANDGFTLPVK